MASMGNPTRFKDLPPGQAFDTQITHPRIYIKVSESWVFDMTARQMVGWYLANRRVRPLIASFRALREEQDNG